MYCGCANNMRFPFFDDLTRQSFKRLPMTTEWTRFRKYARRMREFAQYAVQDPPSPEVLSDMQLYTINEPLFPNLKALSWEGIAGSCIPFIPLFLSPRTTSIDLSFSSDSPITMVASMVTTLPTLCPDLQAISLFPLPRDPIIATAVSAMLLATNRNTLRELCVGSPLTEEASDVIYKLPNLHSLSMVIERETSLPSASLPNLTGLGIICDDEDDWPRVFHGTTFGKLKSVIFIPQSKQIGDFLGAFERAALSSSVQNTLSEFCLYTSCSWNPNYSSLLPFTQLVELDIRFSCDSQCSSRLDDNIITDLARAMPKLEILRLGDVPCRRITIGVTTKGLAALSRHCPDLYILRIHLEVASLSDQPAIPGIIPNTGPTASRTDCALTDLEVGETPVPEGSALAIALTLLHIFPRLDSIESIGEGWEEVENAINISKWIIDCSGKQRPLTVP